jgi:hypothetical protein
LWNINAQKDASNWAGKLCGDLIGLDLNDVFHLFHGIANLFEPVGNGQFFNAFSSSGCD